MAFPTAEMVFVTVTSCGQASHEISREMEVVFDVFALRSHWCFLVVDTFVTITMHDRLTLTLAIEIYFEIPGFLKASFAPTPTNQAGVEGTYRWWQGLESKASWRRYETRSFEMDPKTHR